MVDKKKKRRPVDAEAAARKRGLETARRAQSFAQARRELMARQRVAELKVQHETLRNAEGWDKEETSKRRDAVLAAIQSQINHSLREVPPLQALSNAMFTYYRNK